MNKYVWTYLLLLYMGCGVLRAQDAPPHTATDTIGTMRYRIFYRVNSTRIDSSYMDNAARLDEIDRYLARSPRMDSIVIYSYASPEGPFQRNRYLADKRGEMAKRYILSRLPEGSAFHDSLIHLRPEAENWEGLYEEALLGYREADRNEVLQILTSSLPDEQKKQQLKRLNQGRSWRTLVRQCMPQLRYATWIAVWGQLPKLELELPPQADYLLTLTPCPAPSLLPPPIKPSAYYIEDRHTVVAIKSNLLYDAITWLNFAIEIPFSQRFSLLYYHQFPWWRGGQNNNKYCMRFLGIGGEARWWFRPMPRPADPKHVKRDKLMGHFLGLYGQGGKWDFERKRHYCYQGEFWSAGLTYGYAMPIGRRLNLELSLSVGYASIPYRHYFPTEDYELLIRDRNKTGTWHYVGPTKAEVALVLPILVKTKKKGGVL